MVKQSKYFTVIVDEATDVSFKEQVSICIRYLTLNNYHTFLLRNYSQVGSFPLWSLREGVHRERFRLMSDVDACIDDIRPQ